MGTLVVRRAGADEYGKTAKVLLAGDPGSGKTRLSSTAPNVIYANIEGGLMSVTDREPAFVDITKTDDLHQLRIALAQPPEQRERILEVPVETVVIDTIDNLQRMFIAERLEEQRKESMAQADWGWLGDQLRAVVRSFRNLDMHVIFTCHIKSVEDSETGRSYVKPALQGAMQDEIAAYVDLALLLRAQPTTKVIEGEARRVLARSCQTFPDINHPWLKDRSGRLPMEFDVNLNDDFPRMCSLVFAGDRKPSSVAGSIEATATKVTPPTPPAATSTTKKAAGKKAAGAKADPPAEKVPEEVFQAPEQQSEAESAPETPAESDAAEAPAEPDTAPETAPEQAPAEPETPPAAAVAAPEQELKETSSAAPPAEAPTAPEQSASSAGIPCENADCTHGGVVENEDQADLSRIRFRKVLCRGCFTEAKKK